MIDETGYGALDEAVMFLFMYASFRRRYWNEWMNDDTTI